VFFIYFEVLILYVLLKVFKVHRLF